MVASPGSLSITGAIPSPLCDFIIVIYASAGNYLQQEVIYIGTGNNFIV